MPHDDNFFANRLASLRIQKGVSARDMSLSIGQSANYINKIESKKSYPSMTMFFHICEYLDVTPKAFFDANSPNPARVVSLLNDLNSLYDETLHLIHAIVRKVSKEKK